MCIRWLINIILHPIKLCSSKHKKYYFKSKHKNCQLLYYVSEYANIGKNYHLGDRRKLP